MDDEAVDAVLDVRRGIPAAEQPFVVRFVLGEENWRGGIAIEVVIGQALLEQRVGMVRADYTCVILRGRLIQLRPGATVTPGPGVAKPQCGQYVQVRRFGATVDRLDLDEQILRTSLGVLHEHIEVTVFLKHPGVQQFVFEILPAAAAVGLNEVGIREWRLRVLVEVLHVRVRWSVIEIEVVFLHVLAVVALAVGQTEEAFFQDRVPAVPQRERETEDLVIIGDACQPVFAPVIGARSRLVVREIVPRIAVLAVIFADRSPLPFAQVRTPLLPLGCGIPRS